MLNWKCYCDRCEQVINLLPWYNRFALPLTCLVLLFFVASFVSCCYKG